MKSFSLAFLFLAIKIFQLIINALGAFLSPFLVALKHHFLNNFRNF